MKAHLWKYDTKLNVIMLLNFLCLLLVISCRENPPQKASLEVKEKEIITVGYGAPALDAGQVAIMDGFVRQAKAKGWNVITTNANSDSQTQASQIEYFVSLGVDAIIVVPVDSQKVCESVIAAKEAGIPFYTIDRAPIGCDINMTVLANDYLAGIQAGNTMIKLLNDRYGKPSGTILELQGDLHTNVALLRRDGFHSVITQYADITVISKPTGWQANRFALATREVLSSMEIDGVYVHADGIALPVILPIFEQFGKKIPCGEEGHIFLTGVGGSPAGLQAIRDRYADQTSGLPLFDFGIIANWIQKELSDEKIQEGDVVEEGVLWSPAIVEQGETGWQLVLATTSVTIDNVDHPGLWGNRQVISEQ